MPDLRKPYRVVIGGMGHTLLLTAETAARYGDRAVEVKKSAPEPAPKRRKQGK